MRGRSRQGSVYAFGEGDLRAYLGERQERLVAEVRQAAEDYLLSVSEVDYVDYLVDRYQVECLELHFDQVTVTDTERDIPAEEFPGGSFAVTPGRAYPKTVLTFHVPASGDLELIRMKASTSSMAYELVHLGHGEVTFESVVFWPNEPERIAKSKEASIQRLRQGLAHLRADVDAFNSRLPAVAKSVLQGQKEALLAKGDFIRALGVPLKEKRAGDGSYAVPSPVRKSRVQVTPPPQAATRSSDPFLAEADYRRIVESLSEVGRSMERAPGTFGKMDEEDLRLVMWTHLDLNFEAETSGETFNKEGKTDILMRHDGANLFVAECLIWKGEKYYSSKIDQLFGYLTWRDSKAAIVAFVKAKNLSAAIDAVERSTPDHEHHVSTGDRPHEAWFNYTFHLPGDEAILIQVAVLLVHLPQ